MNEYLHVSEKATSSPPYGILIADHFRETYGFYGHRPAGTKDWLLVYTVSGAGQFRIDRDIQTCSAGDVAILSPGMPHHYATAPNSQWELLWVHFVPLPDWLEWLQLPRTKEQLIYLTLQDESVKARIQDAFRRLIQDSSRKGVWHQQLASIALSEILVLLHSEHLSLHERSQDGRANQILSYLIEHLQEPQQLSELAERFHLSVSRMCHLFKEQYGDSIIGTLLTLRLQKAAKLLEYTGRQVNEISVDVGFESPYYFSRKFNAHFGCSPTLYRKQAREKWE
ncbi:helix-turn-helix domain-containing protein [Paenibacillus koleovorans]|uniref:helix-turn-helix domain-containing protein n=1 Tax=Paenibacillus koleovorans TaxID=121608 RepID=UPI000FD9A73E|nr:helix-turn-helix domain-containing protein [Paenibacillus koleovorans]